MDETTRVEQHIPDVSGMTTEEVDALIKERLKHKELHTHGLVKRYGKRTVT